MILNKKIKATIFDIRAPLVLNSLDIKNLIKIEELSKIKEVKEFTIYNGGPVSNKNLYFIYKTKEPIKGSLKVTENLYWGGNIDEIFKLIKEKVITKSKIRFFIGYSGWDNNQLKNEIKNKNWIVGKNKTGNILNINSQKHWKNEMKQLGGEYLLWSNTPENPYQN